MDTLKKEQVKNIILNKNLPNKEIKKVKKGNFNKKFQNTKNVNKNINKVIKDPVAKPIVKNEVLGNLKRELQEEEEEILREIQKVRVIMEIFCWLYLKLEV